MEGNVRRMPEVLDRRGLMTGESMPVTPSDTLGMSEEPEEGSSTSSIALPIPKTNPRRKKRNDTRVSVLKRALEAARREKNAANKTLEALRQILLECDGDATETLRRLRGALDGCSS